MADMKTFVIQVEDDIKAVVIAEDDDKALELYLERDDSLNPEMADDGDDLVFRQEQVNRMWVHEADFPVIHQV